MEHLLRGSFLRPLEIEAETKESDSVSVPVSWYLDLVLTIIKMWRAKKVERRIDAYTFLPLIHHMVDRFGWTEEESQATFVLLKKFYKNAYWERESPSEKVDEMWHAHLLFSKEYRRFCKWVYGGFLDHCPRGRT